MEALVDEPVLAVDFGTTSSSAAVVSGERVKVVREPGSGLWAWPSTVCWDGGVLMVGSPAERRKRNYPERYRDRARPEQASEISALLRAVLLELAERRELRDTTPAADWAVPVGLVVTNGGSPVP